MTRRSRSTQGPPRVGVRDVARLAGVSTQTVSRVINNSPQLRAETRERVLEAIAALDYRPNNAARALGTSTTRTLGVIATDATLYGPALAISALATATRETDRWIAAAYADAADDASVEAAVTHLLGQGVDGLVLVAPHARTRDTLQRRNPRLPVVIMHAGPPDRQAEAAAAVTAHLVELGHRRLARVGGPSDWLEEASRAEGFASVLAEHGLTAVPGWTGDWSASSGAALAPAVARAVGMPTGPSAVVVANDQMALGLVSGLRELGVDVPGAVSITGFDDNPDTAFYAPALTTVRLDVLGEARRCVAEVFGAEDATVPDPPQVVARASTARPA